MSVVVVVVDVVVVVVVVADVVADDAATGSSRDWQFQNGSFYFVPNICESGWRENER